MRSRACVLVATAVAAVCVATPSSAQQVAVTDPAGDAEGPGLDIVAARVDNGDYRIVAWIRFEEEARGDVIVSVDRRHGRGLRLVNEHRPNGSDTNYVLPGAFTDKSSGPDAQCPGFRARWQADRPVVRLRLPADCLNSGSYGAIRFAVLTERRDDTDYAPEEPDDASSWLPRG
jgi:hypothetical protein